MMSFSLYTCIIELFMLKLNMKFNHTSEEYEHMDIAESFVIDHREKSLPFYIEMSGITYPDPTYRIKREIGSYYVLEYVIEGSGVIDINGKLLYPSAGDVYLIPCGIRQSYYSSKEEPYKKIWMNVNGKLCEHLIDIYGISGIYLFKNINLYHLFEKFLNTCKKREGTTDDVFNKCSLIFMEIIQQLSTHSHYDHSLSKPAVQAKIFCDNNVYQKLTISEIAKHVNLSSSQINRLFKNEYNITIYEYILKIKIKTAKSLLTGTNMSVKEISNLLNFSDEHYFSNVFKARTGKRPSAYRDKP